MYNTYTFFNFIVDRVSASRFGSSLRVAREIALHEGGIPAFYRGLTPNLVGNSVSWGLYFLWYSNIKDLLYRRHGSSGQNGLGSADFFVASGTAGNASFIKVLVLSHCVTSNLTRHAFL